MSEGTSTKIKKELSEIHLGWMAKEVMNLIYERTGLKHHGVHIYQLLYKWGVTHRVQDAEDNSDRGGHSIYGLNACRSAYDSPINL